MLPSLGVLALWVGVILSARGFPTEFDWRYMTMSVLLSPRDNPSARIWAAAGVGACGLAVLCWTIALSPVGRLKAEREWNPKGTYWLRCGAVCMIGAGGLPIRIPGIPKGHEILTLLAFAGLCIGLLRLTLDLASHGPQRAAHVGVPSGPVGAVLVALLAAPILLAGLAQAYVYYVLPELHWVGLSWRARGVPVYLSFAFWEWMTVVVLSIYLVGIGFAVGRRMEIRDARDGPTLDR